jgi:acetylornithine deacetylase
MNVFELTRRLVDIESVTPNERAVGEYLAAHLQPLVAGHGGRLERLRVEDSRENILAVWGEPAVTLSTHQDTVPPFIPSREDDEFIWGRGACDAKGIMAAMIAAAERLLADGVRNFALLFVVGEERGSAGARAAARDPRGSRFLINGEPTENRLALGSKGALRFELAATGRRAHSAYPELGESAIDKLLDALARVRAISLPEDPVLGPATLNIGTISGGEAPNVIPGEARAELMFRVVGDPAPLRRAVAEAARGLADAREILCLPAQHLEALPGFGTTVVSYTTDIPVFEGAWGRPLLLGPGSIHVAHTDREHIPKQQMLDAVAIYQRMVRSLLASGAAGSTP